MRDYLPNMKLSIGTKSILFGVHAFWFHPWTVALAWRDIYWCWPRGWAEWLAVFFHDVGYWGSQDIDGTYGQMHPYRSADFVYWGLKKMFSEETRDRASALILGHSRFYCYKHMYPKSKLYAADKICVLFDPPWFYLLRAKLSGEIWEYMHNAGDKHATPEEWLLWYRAKVRKEFDLE